MNTQTDAWTAWLSCMNYGAVHKGRQQRRGRGFGQMRAHADRGVKDLADVRKLVLYCFSMLCRHSLWMMPIKVQIVIHLIRFATQCIIWAGTKAYIHLTLRVRLLIT